MLPQAFFRALSNVLYICLDGRWMYAPLQKIGRYKEELFSGDNINNLISLHYHLRNVAKAAYKTNVQHKQMVLTNIIINMYSFFTYCNFFITMIKRDYIFSLHAFRIFLNFFINAALFHVFFCFLLSCWKLFVYIAQ